MIKGMQEVIDVMTKAKADLDKNGGLKQVIFVACGGSFASSYPARFLLNQESSIRVQGYNSSEFVNATPKNVDKNTLVIGTSTKATAETVEALKVAKAKGAVTKTGDVWKLGVHRLMCGDSTSEVDFAKLMNGNKAQMTVTSPPYGVGKDYESKGIEPWFETMRPVVKNLTRYAGIVCWNLGDLYATGTQFIEPTNFYSSQLFSEQGFRPIWIRIWKKQGQNFGVGPYHLVTNKPVQQYEYISAFSKNGDVEYNDQEYMWLSAYAGHAYRFVKRLTKEERKNWGYAGIWEMNTVRANKDHPAMYPVELPWRCIKMHSDRGDIVLEPFSGSGTTIIACEQLERVCYAMEKSPEYCDLAVKRWEQFTGQKAERITSHADAE